MQKDTPNKGRSFYACPKGPGAGCNFFKWDEGAGAPGGGGGGFDDGGGGGGGGGGFGGWSGNSKGIVYKINY